MSWMARLGSEAWAGAVQAQTTSNRIAGLEAQVRDLQQALRTEREAKEAYKAHLERAEAVIQRLSRDMPGMWLRQEEISPSAEIEG